MKLVQAQLLQQFAKKHADARPHLAAWQLEARKAEWKTPVDIRRRYPNASFIGNDRVVFNIRADNYRLDVRVSYSAQVVVVMRVGTHAEYDRWKF